MSESPFLLPFRKVLSDLVGAECWSVVAGAGTGSVILLQIGEKLPRDKVIPNPHLSEDARRFDGEFHLYVEAVWRLDSHKGVVCGAWDDNRAGGPMLKGLSRLRGSIVESFDLEEVGMDLVFKFSNNLKLKIFCDQLNEADQGDNYTLGTQGDSYIVGRRSILRWEKAE